MPTPVAVVMRSHDDMPLIADTVTALRRQRFPFELVLFDNASSDGSREVAGAAAAAVVDVPAGSYVPGRVLNQAMSRTAGNIVVFLNADCTPADDWWLERLLAPFEDPSVAAAFSRQRPRSGCDPFQARDTESAYGDGAGQTRWRHCFSMAASAVRRSAWLEDPFRDDLQYSEDIDWTWRQRGRGHRIVYVPDSTVYHSHNYSLAQAYRRQFGEGRAEASIFTWTRWQRSFLRFTALPYLRQVLADWRYCATRGAWAAIAMAPVYRACQAAGRRAGFVTGFAALRGHAR